MNNIKELGDTICKDTLLRDIVSIGLNSKRNLEFIISDVREYVAKNMYPSTYKIPIAASPTERDKYFRDLTLYILQMGWPTESKYLIKNELSKPAEDSIARSLIANPAFMKELSNLLEHKYHSQYIQTLVRKHSRSNWARLSTLSTVIWIYCLLGYPSEWDYLRLPKPGKLEEARVVQSAEHIEVNFAIPKQVPVLNSPKDIDNIFLHISETTQPRKAIIMADQSKFFTLIPHIYGVPLNHKDPQAVLDTISRMEDKIKRMKQTTAQPRFIQSEIAAAEADLKELIDWLDAQHPQTVPQGETK